MLVLFIIIIIIIIILLTFHTQHSFKTKKTCPICFKASKRSDNLIQCNFCDDWIHRVKCCLLTSDEFIKLSKDEEAPWCCPKCVAETLPFNCTRDNDLFIENLRLTDKLSEVNIIPQNRFNEFIGECNSVSNYLIESIDNNDLNVFPNPVNSKYHDIHQFTQIKPVPISSLSLMHTNLASFGKHFDDLNLILSLVKFDFHIICISEHKIHKNDCNSMTNIDLDGYHSFVFDPTEISHCGTGFSRLC